jgi:peptidoglycan/LPS O-acetylase OafA/YrhL
MQSTHPRARLPYSPGIDGLRAVAVLAVILFHAGADWLPGGYLGVDVFFVISGFLITSLLLAEHQLNGSIGFGAFWSRRARRLLPALFLLLVVMSLWAASEWADPFQKHEFRGDALSSLFYFANWHFVGSGAGYFGHFSAPSPLRHLWSLAIEEQFYLVWPVLVAVLLGARRVGRRRLLRVSLLGAVVSATLMALLYDTADPSAVYFRTDTHAFGLLMGAAAAAYVAADPDRRSRPFRALAPFAFAGLLACLVLVDGTSTFAYRGGLPLAALAAVPVVVAASRPGWLARGLSFRPLVVVGLVSYGLYLWHWPVWTILTNTRLELDEPLATLARVATLVAFTGGSYLLLEQPVRRGFLGGRTVRFAAPGAIACVAGVILAVGTAPPVFTPAVAAPSRSSPSGAREPSRPTILLVGDSTAASAATGFVDTAGRAFRIVPAGLVPPTKREGEFCPLDIQLDGVRPPSGAEVITTPPRICDWHRYWPRLVNAYRPRVAVVMFGSWDAMAHRVANRWLYPGTPEWNAQLETQLRCAVDLLSARGARVLVVLAPKTVLSVGEWTDALNAVYGDVAAGDPARVSVADPSAAILTDDPNIRWDGVHYTHAGARVLADAIRPALDAALAAAPAPPPLAHACSPPPVSSAHRG